MTEFWVPITQNENSVLYGDMRLMSDDQDNREGNLGLGYRQFTRAPFLDAGVVGVHAWIDRRRTERGSIFHQVTIGGEWLGENVDILANGYVPLSDGKQYTVPNANPSGPTLAGTGIFVDTSGTILEEPQHGFDIEFGWQVPFLKENTDSIRVYGGGYYFNSGNTEDVLGWRARVAADITSDIQIGARFQHDDERGSQGFLEATIRFPFGQKRSFRSEGLHARLDDAPERDIDIVTSSTVTDSGDRVQVLNTVTGQAQEILHVDNTAGGGGDGSAEAPFNTLAAAQAAVGPQGIIYVHTGDGTSANQDQGITLNKPGQQLIGSGTDFVYDSSHFTTANGASPLSTLLIPATAAPVITNANVLSDGITVTADDVKIAGIAVNGATRDGITVTGNNVSIESIQAINNVRHGIYGLNITGLSLSSLFANNNGEDGVRLEAAGAGHSLTGAILNRVAANGNKNGIRLYANTDASVSAAMERSDVSGNTQHGIIVYDDSTAGDVTADLGGGASNSLGLNIIAGSAMEDLALDTDGAAVSAMNNWWGQAGGPLATQIYYGAVVDDGLIGHWTLDDGAGGMARDRSLNGNDGTLTNGPTWVAGAHNGAASFDGINDYIIIPNEQDYDLGTGDFTLLGWARLTTVPDPIYSIIVSKGVVGTCCAADGYPGYELGELGSAAGVRVEDTAAGINAKVAAVNSAPYEGGWHFYVGRRNGGTLYTFIDGVQVASNNTLGAGANLDNNSPLGIGANLYFSQAKFMSGLIDDVRVYDRALGDGEIGEIYRMNSTGLIDAAGALNASP